MIQSMTGYGQARWQGDGRVVLVEVRTVNGRYFKLNARVPHEFSAAERDLEKLIRSRVQRGSVELYVKVEFAGARAARALNKEALATYLEELREVAGRLGVAVGVSADALALLPGVLDADEIGDEEAAGLLARVHDALGAALDELDAMRQAEGSNLEQEFLRHCEAVEGLIGQVEAEHPDTLEQYKERLTDRVNRLLRNGKIAVTEQDLAREIAIYAERSSVCEEIARVRSHVQQFREALERGGSVGRRLEFLAQEMHREVNTMGSKVADVGLSRRIVDLHDEVDKIREQALNVE